MAPSYDSLHLNTSRRSTFHKTRKGVHRSQNWPFPLTAAASKSSTIHPDHLAQAGFYSTPTADDSTVTTCFACEVAVGVWEEGEDPLSRHLAAVEEAELECPWATIQEASWESTGGLEGKGSSAEWERYWGPEGKLHPRGEIMDRARKGTFALGWPNHGKAGVPTADEIASAGWYFRPGSTAESADRCVCPYCIRTVEGWEEGDDPVACHNRKIGVNCPFFIAPVPGASRSAPTKAKQGKASTASSAASSSSLSKKADKTDKAAVKPKKGKKAAEHVVEEEEEVEEESEELEADVEEEEPEVQPRTRATRSASVSTVTSAPAPARPNRRTKATPAPSEDEAEAAPVLKKSARSRTATNVASAAAPAKSSRSRKADIDVDVAVEVHAPAPSSSSSSLLSKSTKKAVEAPTSSSASSETKSKKAISPPTTLEKHGIQDAAVLPADESITDLAMIANAAYELQPSSTEEAEIKKPSSKQKSKAKASKTSTKSSSSTASAKGKGSKEVETHDEDSSQSFEAGPSRSAAPVPNPQSGPLPVSTASPSASSNGRQIRSLPSKVNPSKSPSSSSLSSKAALQPPKAAVPPIPTVSLASAPTVDPSTTIPLPFPTSSSTNRATDDNPFAPNRILELLPPPTADELATLTVGEWYNLLGQRVHNALKQEMDGMQRGLEKRVQEGRARLEGMCREAKLKEEAEERAAEDRRRAKKAEKAQASARKQQASSRKAVR
ncbi:baculoviral IAP repeat-containing protein [Sporobolomyces koalae]|uniref:baculoviral IAP repeat-containing protein n=1 Tax=Sporobolomyces koalae TaxID=500713 RepID=UPI0031780F01